MPKYLLVHLKVVHLKGFILFLLWIVCFSYFNQVRAVELWTDQFDSVDNSLWTVLNETDTTVIYSGEAWFRNISPYRSLFFQNTVPLPTGDISVEVQFRYLNSSYNFGNGIAVNENPVSLRSGVHPGGTDWTIFVWPTGGTNFKVFSSICPSVGTCVTDNVYTTVSGANFTSLHKLRIEYLGNIYKLYLDDVYLGETVSTTRSPRYVWLGNPMTTSTTVSISQFYVDYVTVTDFASPPVPTFPYLSQKDPAWADEIYDQADAWAPDGEEGIGRWGCTPTSVAMVLDYYGVNMPDGSAPNPSRVNAWLKSQPDGYIGPGLLNWMAITRLARESYQAGYSDTKLEFLRTKNTASIAYPSILGLPGHFVVAHAEDGDDWIINDPNDIARVELPKTSSVVSVNHFSPSLTDLSYMMFVTGSDQDVGLKDESGNTIDLDWSEEYLLDQVDNEAGPSIKTAFVAKPSAGKYILTTGSQSSEQVIDGYFYDQAGTVSEQSFVVPANIEADFVINYASISGTPTQTALDHTEFIAYLESQRVKKTKTYAVYKSIINQFNRLVKKNKPFTTLIKYVERRTPKIITSEDKDYVLNYLILVDANRP